MTIDCCISSFRSASHATSLQDFACCPTVPDRVWRTLNMASIQTKSLPSELPRFTSVCLHPPLQIFLLYSNILHQQANERTSRIKPATSPQDEDRRMNGWLWHRKTTEPLKQVSFLFTCSLFHTHTGLKKGNRNQTGIKESKLLKLSRLFNSPSSKCWAPAALNK